MDLYHGTNKVFDRFELAHKGSGEGASLLIGHGIYLSESPVVADFYRQRTADPRYFGTNTSYWQNDVRFTKEEIREEDHSDFQEQHGSVFKVQNVNPETLLVWEGGVDDQPFNVLDILRELYDPEELEAIEHFIEQAEDAEDIQIGMSVEEVVEKAMLYGPNYTHDLMMDCSREEVDWNLLTRLIGNRGLDLPEDNDRATGAVLYGKLDAHFGSEELATKWLSERGIHGVIAKLELPLGNIPENHQNARTVVYWRIEDLSIQSALSPHELSALNEVASSSTLSDFDVYSVPSF